MPPQVIDATSAGLSSNSFLKWLKSVWLVVPAQTKKHCLSVCLSVCAVLSGQLRSGAALRIDMGPPGRIHAQVIQTNRILLLAFDRCAR